MKLTTNILEIFPEGAPLACDQIHHTHLELDFFECFEVIRPRACGVRHTHL